MYGHEFLTSRRAAQRAQPVRLVARLGIRELILFDSITPLFLPSIFIPFVNRL